MHRLVIALVTLIGLTGAAFVAGYAFLFSASTDRAAAMAPADSALYLNVYLQPSTGQQMNLGGLIGRLPGFADDASLDEKIDQVVQNLLGGSGIDYREQLKPWIGNQVTLVAWPSDEGVAQPTAVLLVDVKDRELAESSVAELVGEGEESFSAETYQGAELQVAETGSYAFVGEMLVVGEAADGIRAVVDVERGAAGSIGEREDFRATMAELPADHLASAFVDLAAIAEAADLGEQAAQLSTAGAVLVAERDGLRLSGSAPFDVGEAEASARAGFALGGEPSSLVDWMPEDTIASAVVFGLRQTLEEAEAAARLTPEGEELGSALDQFRAIAAFGLGIDLDNDILPLIDREVGVALAGVDGGLPSGQLLLRPDDPEAAADALGRLADRLGSLGAESRTEEIGEVEVTVVSVPDIAEVAYSIVDGIVIVGLAPEDVVAAIEAHRDGGTLGSSDLYSHAFEVAGARAGNELFVDIDGLLGMIEEDDALPDDARDILQQLGAFGFTAPSRDDRIEFHAVLTVEEAGPE
ncbi:MAG: DUF3352 domain-containing protein [Candidatus Limnocylindria bacterium]